MIDGGRALVPGSQVPVRATEQKRLETYSDPGVGTPLLAHGVPRVAKRSDRAGNSQATGTPSGRRLRAGPMLMLLSCRNAYCASKPSSKSSAFKRQFVQTSA